MNSIKVALLQLLPEDTLKKNMDKGLDACRQAAAMGADIALFPEMWSCGYNFPSDNAELCRLAIDSDSEYLGAFRLAAAELGIAIGVTYLAKGENAPTNTLTVFDRHGESVLTYSKVHTCDFGDERVLEQGENFYVSELDTKSGKLMIGAMICYDREFPESARLLMLKGAELILVPNACPMEINRISQLRARAFENMLGIATVNYPYGKPDCNGHSTAFDGIAYREDESGSRDTLILEAGEREGIYLADFPIDDIREYRKKEVHANAFRRPEKYGLLTDSTVNEPFIRKEKRK
ncbi:MAG: carbon-nitrogen hydrolase family protein [Ruminiclostridium sp.]